MALVGVGEAMAACAVPTPNPSRRREGDCVALPAPLPFTGGVGGGPVAPDDLTTPPLFGPAQQAVFCDRLAQHGNARAACKAAGVSAQTAYRLRRASAAFRAMWNAALLVARDHVEQVLADRALNGVEEVVFYHGEEVATRRRYDSRLLLAHLARLDKLAEAAECAALAERFEAGLERLEAGEGTEAQSPAQAQALSQAGGEQGEDEVPDPAEIPLLELQLRWIEAHYGVLSEEEEIFHLQNTVPGVPPHELAVFAVVLDDGDVESGDDGGDR